VKASPYCLPCIIQQVSLTVRKARVYDKLGASILKDLIDWLPGLDLDRSPAEIASDCLIRCYKTLGIRDPFKSDKQVQHRYASKVSDLLRPRLARVSDPLYLALKCAIGGNLIDSLVLQDKAPGFQTSFIYQPPLGINHYHRFQRVLNRSKNIFYILDNMGEAVFDEWVINELRARGKKVTCVVRQKPILNDVIREDARAIGLNRLGPVIHPDVWAIGLPLHLASARFRKRFRQADLVISKGQANFETLEGVEKNSLFFCFVVKCDTVARHLGVGVKLGSRVLLQNKPLK